MCYRCGHVEQLVSIRRRIQEGALNPADFRAFMQQYITPDTPEAWSDPPRYDRADACLDALLQFQAPPDPLVPITSEMIPYQTTPVRLILEMVDRLALTSDDVVYDLGAGLGRVVFAVALLSTSTIKGVEIEPAYVEYARQHADKMKLTTVSFIHADARVVDYTDGTVFFLYTPFKGTILRRVLALLRAQARAQRIRLCTYGPGTLEVQDQDWLTSDDDPEHDIHHVTIFNSTQKARRAPVMHRRRQRR